MRDRDLFDFDLYVRVVHCDQYGTLLESPKDISEHDLNLFISKCVFWLESYRPEYALAIVKRYNLDGQGSKTFKEIGELLPRKNGVASLNRARLIVFHAIKILHKAHTHGFDMQLLKFAKKLNRP